MTKLEQHLSQYAAYHLDRKNIYTHFIGIPIIVFSIICLLAALSFHVAGWQMTLAGVVLVFTTLYYLSLDKVFGALMGLIFIAAYPLAIHIAAFDTTTWLSWSIGLFVVGWIFQFIGHIFEKKKPAFVDDLMGLVIGPLFVLAEFVFLLGFRKDLAQRINQEGQRQRHAMDQPSVITRTP